MTNTPTQAAIEAAARALCEVLGHPQGEDEMVLATNEAFVCIEAYRAAMREAGFVEVPVEPTKQQIAAGWRWAFQHSERCYSAMIAARPQIGGE